jgi:predicted nucleotidyltransferase
MAKLELTHLDLPSRHLALLLNLLKTYAPQAQVWAYGSRVIGGAHEGSDLDLVLRNPQNLSLPCASLVALREALQASALPILVDVHDWAQLPLAFQRNIDAMYVELQAASSI